jgi:hypothetical protein
LGLEVQTAESNVNALNLMAFSKVPDITPSSRRPMRASGSAKKRYDSNGSNLLRRSDQWPFLQRGVPAMGSSRAASRLPHAHQTAPKDQLREDGKDRATRAPGELGHRERRSPKGPTSRTITQ